MALASFFDKSALSALQTLDVSYEAFRERIEKVTLGILFGPDSFKSNEGLTILELFVNMAARLYPRLCFFFADDVATESVANELIGIASRINPAIVSWLNPIPMNVDALVVVGMPDRATCPEASTIVYVGSAGWTAYVSREEPIGCGATIVPFGAVAAACFGAAETFKAIFGLPTNVDRHVQSFSLAAMEGGTNKPGPDVRDEVDIGDNYLVGCGAIGNALLWTLARIPNLAGTVHLIDAEGIELSNLQRYVLAFSDDISATKVSLGTAILSRTNLRVVEHAVRWGQFVAEFPDLTLSRVLSAVDSADVRRSIQAVLPRRILNAWTQPGDLGVSRHWFGTDEACLMCLYLPVPATDNMDRTVAAALGIPADFMLVRQLLFTGEPVDETFIARVADANSVPIGSLSRFVGLPLIRFYSEGVCGGMLLSGKPRGQAAHVPLAFQSVMAGALLAAELVAESIAGPRRMTITQFDVMRPFGPEVSRYAAARSDSMCFCQDSDYVNRYRSKYPDYLQ